MDDVRDLQIVITFLGCFLLSACRFNRPLKNQSQTKPLSKVYTLSKIDKGQIIIKNRMEATPFNWHGQLMYLASGRGEHEGQEIEIWPNWNTTYRHPTHIGLVSALAISGRLFVFGTTDWSKSNKIKMLSTANLLQWTKPVTVFEANQGTIIYNTSVAPAGSEYVMAYEVREPNTVPFSIRFAISRNLKTWSSIGGIFKPKEYAACPTIRFVDGYYYLFYLKHLTTYYATFIARSRNLVDWIESSKAVLSPLGYKAEGINNSDFDLIEMNGRTIINYAIGNQSSTKGWSDIKQATFNGSIKDFVSLFF